MKLHLKSRRGMTLVELMFAVMISAGVTFGIFSLALVVLRQERTNTTILMMSAQAAKLHRLMRDRTAMSNLTQILDGDGTQTNPPTIQFTDKTVTPNVVSAIRFENTDNNTSTIIDNRLVYYPDIANMSNKRTVMERVTQIYSSGALVPIFRRATPAVFATPVEINFRVGDTTNPANRMSDTNAKRDDGVTGPGFQSFVVREVFVGRNI